MPRAKARGISHSETDPRATPGHAKSRAGRGAAVAVLGTRTEDSVLERLLQGLAERPYLFLLAIAIAGGSSASTVTSCFLAATSWPTSRRGPGLFAFGMCSFGTQ